jgi:hypothetical protein
MNSLIPPLVTPPCHHRPLFLLGRRRALRLVLMAALGAALLTQPSYVQAQHSSAPAGPSEKEKAKAQEKRIYEKDTDEAYKSTLSRIPDSKQKVDPWGSIRTAPAK